MRHRLRRRLRPLLVIPLVAAVMAAALTAFQPAAPAQAADASAFDAGNIISDELFFDGNAMSAAQVQAFLNSQVSSCSPGYTCLKDYRQDTSSRAAEAGRCDAYNGAANESAAQIIAKVGVACGISQKVLIVLLQKEQSLVTSTAPSSGRYRSATGYGCPDTAPCDSLYYGFFNQVYMAALQFKRYAANPGGYNYQAGRVNSILYNPNPGCGAGDVYIANKATAGLYDYTPYQPNAAALANLYGTGDSCSSYGNRNFWRIYTDWFGPTTADPYSPVGQVETTSTNPGTGTVSGWAIDPETTAPVTVHVYVGGRYEDGATWGGQATANLRSNTVLQQHPSYGAAHGFTVTLSLPRGSTTVCLYAINVGRGSNQLIGCPTLTTPTGPPTGNFESAKLSGRTATLTGWAMDPDTSDPITVHVYSGGPYGTGDWAGQAAADRARPDVAAVYPAYGSSHGFTISVNVGVGTTPLCVYAINVGGGDSTLLGCRTVSTASGPPRGSLDALTPVLGGITVRGWALDPDTPKPIEVHVYVDGVWGGRFTAQGDRPDVAAAFPGYGAAHGYSGTVPAEGGRHEVCAYGINVMSGANTLLACKTVTVVGGPPTGNFESLSADKLTAHVTGWATDPDGPASVVVHVYVNGNWAGAFVADAQRPDVGAAFPGQGNAHGFDVTVPLSPGVNEVCVFAIDPQFLRNPQLGCRTVTADAKAPTGSYDSLWLSGTSARLTGWAVDPETTAPVGVHVYVNGQWGGAFTADKSRPDVAAALGKGDKHGFDVTVPVPTGTSTVCVYAIDPQGVWNPSLGCKTVRR